MVYSEVVNESYNGYSIGNIPLRKGDIIILRDKNNNKYFKIKIGLKNVNDGNFSIDVPTIDGIQFMKDPQALYVGTEK